MQPTTMSNTEQRSSTVVGDPGVPGRTRPMANRKLSFLMPCLRPGMRVLDGGCGSGSITVGLADAVQPGEVVGVDVDAGQLTAARKAASDHGLTNVRFEEASLLSLPFEDDSFDAAYLSSVLEHVTDPAAVLRELCRVVRPGGVIGVRDHQPGAMLATPHD